MAARRGVLKEQAHARGGAVLSIVDGGAFRTHSSTNSLAAPPASILVKVRAYWKIDGEI